MEHTCDKCEACGKASFEQLMACDACQMELDDKIEELDGSASSDRTAGEFSVHDELPRVWRVLAPRADNGRYTTEWPADSGNERDGAS